MSEIANPNWLAIAGYVHLVIGIGLLVKCQLRARSDRMAQEAQRHVDAMTAGLFVFVGVCSIVAGQLATTGLTPSIVVLILSAPAALLLYLGYEGLWVDALVEGDVPTARPRPQVLSLPKPRPEHLQNDAALLDEPGVETLVGAEPSREAGPQPTAKSDHTVGSQRAQ